MLNGHRILSLILISFTCLLFVFYTLFINNFLNKSSILGFISPNAFDTSFFKDNLILSNLNKIKKNNTNQFCLPFNTNQKPNSILLEGQLYPKSLALYKNTTINFDCLNKDTSKKLILFWNPFFSDPYYTFADGLKKPACPVVNCELTINRSRINEANFVITHMRNSIDSLPKSRSSFQRWIFLLYESPLHSPPFRGLNNYYNLTSTYRIDSDFSHFYDTGSDMDWKKNPLFDKNFDFYANKSEFAAALISNCADKSSRLDYIKKLNKLMGISVFGMCGKPCPTKFKNGTSGNCKSIIATEFKFYLAFENSFCDDYITEKFFDILKYNIIPVVRGGGKYDYYIPKSGFIDANEYESPEKLADYLHYLDRNRTAYNAYFKWKEHVVFEKQFLGFPSICDMCIQLNLEKYTGIKKSVIHDIESYWSQKLQCQET